MLDKNNVNDKNIQNDPRKADIFALFYLLTLLFPDQEQIKKKTLLKLNRSCSIQILKNQLFHSKA